jgi:hypothetical protein
LASFVYAEKQAETLFRLNFCKRKTLFRLKNKLKSTDYKPAEQGHYSRIASSGSGHQMVVTVSLTYRAFFADSTKLLGAKELWRAKAPPKVKMFFWLALHRRLWTAERRKRHGLQDDDACALCDQHAETGSHLFLGCAFARQVWFGLLSPFQLVDLVPVDDQDLGTWWIRQRRRIDKTSRPLFDRLLLLIAWSLWKERNARVFARTPSAAHDVIAAITRDGKDWAAAGYAPMAVLEAIWSQNLVAM